MCIYNEDECQTVGSVVMGLLHFNERALGYELSGKPNLYSLVLGSPPHWLPMDNVLDLATKGRGLIRATYVMEDQASRLRSCESTVVSTLLHIWCESEKIFVTCQK